MDFMFLDSHEIYFIENLKFHLVICDTDMYNSLEPGTMKIRETMSPSCYWAYDCSIVVRKCSTKMGNMPNNDIIFTN